MPVPYYSAFITSTYLYVPCITTSCCIYSYVICICYYYLLFRCYCLLLTLLFSISFTNTYYICHTYFIPLYVYCLYTCNLYKRYLYLCHTCILYYCSLCCKPILPWLYSDTLHTFYSLLLPVPVILRSIILTLPLFIPYLLLPSFYTNIAVYTFTTFVYYLLLNILLLCYHTTFTIPSS